MSEKFADYIHQFTGLREHPGRVRIRAYHKQGSPGIVVCSQTPENAFGPSPTNHYEQLVGEVVPELGLDYREGLLWITHYPDFARPEQFFVQEVKYRRRRKGGLTLAPVWSASRGLDREEAASPTGDGEL